MRSIFFTFLLIIACYNIQFAQTGPGGVGNTTGSSELKLWLKADAGTNTTVTGQGVNMWQDQSGAGNTLNSPSATNNPLYVGNGSGSNGMPFLQFDGSNDFFQMAAASSDFNSTEASVFLVGEGAWAGTPFSIAGSGVNDEMLVLNQAIYHHKSSGNFTNKGHQCLGSIPTTEALFMTSIFGTSATDIELHCNQLPSNLTESSSGSPSDYTVQNRMVRVGRRSIGQYFNGKIYELIIYNRKLTAVEQDSVSNYLKNKYALQNNGCGNFNILADGPGGIGNTTGSSELKLWLKADAGTNTTTGGQGVNMWLDQSGAGNDVANGASNNEPTYQINGANGMSYVEFDGNDDFLEMPAASADFNTTESSVFIVGEGAWNGAPFSLASTGINQEMTLLDRVMYHHASSGNFKSREHHCLAAVPNTSAKIATLIWGSNSTDLSYYNNGLFTSQGIGGAGSTGNYINVDRMVRIGRRSIGEYFDSKIYEVIVYDRKLSQIEQDSVHEYLRCKYDIQNNTCGSLSTAACLTSLTPPATQTTPLSIFPNPTQQELNINLEAVELDQIQLLDLSGRVLRTVMASGHTANINVEQLPSGMYFIQVLSIDQQLITKKFIKE